MEFYWKISSLLETPLQTCFFLPITMPFIVLLLTVPLPVFDEDHVSIYVGAVLV